MGKHMDEREVSYEENLIKQQKIFSRTFQEELPESYKCQLCEKEAQLVKINNQVAVYYHDCDYLKDIKELHNTIALWVKRPFGTFSVEHGVILVDINE